MHCADFRRLAVMVAAVLFIAGSANASLVMYSNRAAFLAALPGVGQFESFEDEPIDVQAGSRTISTSTSQISFVGNSAATFGVNNVAVGGRGPTDGTQYLQVGFIDSSNVKFQFAQPLQAFGIDVVDKNNNDLDGVIGDLTVNGAIDPGVEGNVQFWGVIATPDMAFTQVGFAGIGPSVPGDTFALDNVVFSEVPEPSAVLLVTAAVLLCRLISLRRRSKPAKAQ